MTVKRNAILKILQESKRHMRPREIYRAAKEQFPGLVMATVYNSLNALVGAGLIRRIRTADGADFFEGVLDPHEHAVCTRCGEIHDVHVRDLDRLFQACTPLPVLSYDLIIHTVCDNCRTQGDTEDAGSANL